jgi:diguanylate cyclase (GGDEF)-like protein/PAS domain S-box-containing protein
LSEGSRRGVRLSWAGYILAVFLLGLGAWHLAEEQLTREQTAAEARIRSEQIFVANLVRELLQHDNYEEVQHLVGRWGRQHDDLAEVRIVSGEGAGLAEYLRPRPAGRPFALEAEVAYGSGKVAKMRLESDLEPVYRERDRTLLRLAAVLVPIALLGAYLVHSALSCLREAEQQFVLGERFARANAELAQEIEMRKLTEQALADEREGVEVTLNSIGEAVITTDAGSRVTRMNPAAERLTGWQRDEAYGRRVAEVFRIQGPNGEAVESPVERVFRSGGVAGLDTDTMLIDRVGRVNPIADSAAPIHGPKGQLEGVILVFRDVGEDFRMRRALMESETRFRRLVESLVDHFLLSQSGDGGVTYVSPSVTSILGYGQEEFRARFPDELSDAASAASLREYTRQSFCGRRQRPLELEVRADNGDLRTLELRQVPVLDQTGEVTAVEAIAQDVTERRAAQAEERLAASVFENSAEGILVTDLKGVILRVNRAFTAITGYGPGEALGKTTAILHSGRHGPDFYRELWDELRERGHWQGEIWNRRKDGEVYPEWLSISRIPDPNSAGQDRYVGIFTDISQQKAAEAEIARLAFHDALTGLPNRVLLMDRLETGLARAERQGHVDALLFLDLDHFKHVNDSLGHSVGDAMLKEVARRLTESVREYDTVARLGGDEFVVLLNAVADDHHLAVRRARRAAEKIRASIAEPMTIAGHALHTSPSMGVTLLPLDADNSEDALKHADKAMYRAKARGRNTIHFFTLEMQAEAEQRLVLENELRHAVDRQELTLHYQPIIDLSTGRIAGLEALVRWNHPRHGCIPPTRFIAIAEETGLIRPLGDWVLETACRQARLWQQRGLPQVYVSVNLSAVQFRQSDIATRIAEILRASELAPGALEVELTESLLVENIGAMSRILGELEAMGVQLSVDDFGIGYSSLSYLRRFRLHKLKIDRSFVEDLPADPDATAITTTIIQMAHNLGLRTVAEGVETDDQLAFLKTQGADFAQGFLCSRPVPADEIPPLLVRDPAAEPRREGGCA